MDLYVHCTIGECRFKQVTFFSHFPWMGEIAPIQVMTMLYQLRPSVHELFMNIHLHKKLVAMVFKHEQHIIDVLIIGGSISLVWFAVFTLMPEHSCKY